MMDFEKFKSLLDDKYEWPCDYTFKFVVASHNEHKLAEEFLEERVSKKSSRTGKYVSYTVIKEMHSSEDVVSIYSKVGSIDGVMSL